MATIRSKPTGRRQSNLPSPSLYTGAYDDAAFSHVSPQLTRPINIPSPTNNKRPSPSLFASYSSHGSCSSCSSCSDDDDDEDDSAVLNDDDAHSEDELPPSPSRRHSGAMSVSNEDLSSCYDREALRRETAAHRARHHRQREQRREEKQAQQQKAFAAHEQWDCEVDGPHMALWTPDWAGSFTPQEAEENNQSTATTNTNSKRRRMQQEPHQVSYIEGPMMCLWEP